MDEAPAFPEPEEVGPSEPNVDGKMARSSTTARPTVTSAWVFLPAARNGLSAAGKGASDEIASNHPAREIPIAQGAGAVDREEIVTKIIQAIEEAGSPQKQELAEPSALGNWKAADPSQVTVTPKLAAPKMAAPKMAAPKIVATSPSAEPLLLVLPPAEQLRPAVQAAPTDAVSYGRTHAESPIERKSRPVWSPHRPGASRRVAR